MSKGYVAIWFQGRIHLAHRLAFLYMEGEFPPDQVDHINGVRTDNSWPNLRMVAAAENQKNMKIAKNNKSGVTGVSWFKSRGKWVADIGVKGKTHRLGYRDSWFEAVCLRKSAENKYGYHRNHGTKRDG